MSQEMSEMDIHQRVIQSINDQFTDIPSLKNVDSFRNSLLEKQQELDKKLDHANSSISHELQDLLNSGDELDRKVSAITEESHTVVDQARECMEEIDNFGLDNKQILKDISIVRGVAQYTMWLRLIEQISLDISVSLETDDKEQIISSYKRLTDVCSTLKHSTCGNLCEYVSETRRHWYEVLTEKFISRLHTSLQTFNCPFIDSFDNKVTSATDLLKIGKDEVQNLQKSAEILLSIENPPTKSEKKTHLWLPIKVLMKPLRKRFKYHFLGTKATNNPTKPEWFITQLTTWAISHRQFLNEYIQPAYDRVGLHDLAVLDFAKGLVLMAMDKLEVDIPLVLDDDVLFAHTIDEIIGFCGELSKNMQYNLTEPSVLEPLIETNVFNRWLNMERKFAFEKVDNLFIESGASVWESEVGGSFTPRAAEMFLALLLSVTARYKLLTSSLHRIQFLHLQTDLIEDFRVRLVQIVRAEKDSPLSSNLCPILNTLDHLVIVLNNWAETPFFLKLAMEMRKDAAASSQLSPKKTSSSSGDQSPSSDEDGMENDDDDHDDHDEDVEDDELPGLEDLPDLDGTVFQSSIEELKYLKEQLINEVVDSIYYTVTARSVKYRSETKWFLEDIPADSVSPSACEMLQSLAFGLDSARQKINAASFQDVWRQLAARIHVFILEELVLNNKFSLAGGNQLEFDVVTGFFPIFGEFTQTPRSYFADLMDVLTLLKLPAGTLALTLTSLVDTCDQGAANVLKDLGVRNLNRERAIRVLKCRIDLPSQL